MSASPRSAQPDPSQLETVRTGYQVAVDLANRWSAESWSIANGMIVVNSILAVGITFALGSIVAQGHANGQANVTRAAGIVLCITGILLDIVWALMSRRTGAYARYYLHSAREIEEKYLAPYIQTISRGEAFAEGRKVTLQFQDKAKTLQMNIFERMGRIAWGSIILSLTLLALFLLALIYFIFN